MSRTQNRFNPVADKHYMSRRTASKLLDTSILTLEVWKGVNPIWEGLQQRIWYNCRLFWNFNQDALLMLICTGRPENFADFMSFRRVLIKKDSKRHISKIRLLFNQIISIGTRNYCNTWFGSTVNLYILYFFSVLQSLISTQKLSPYLYPSVYPRFWLILSN